ncbi:MAG: hypothetical protein ABEK50_10235 [bacterium]
MKQISVSSLWRKILWVGVLVFFVVLTSFNEIYANDYWKALYSGRYLSLFSHFPHHGTFAFTPVKDILTRNTFNWLGNLVFVGLFSIGGHGIFQFFRLFVASLALLLPWSILSGERRFSAISLVFLLALLFSIKQKFLMRTAIFSVVGVTVLFWIIVRADREGSSKLLWGIPVLFTFWSSMHGSYLVGLGFLFLIVIGHGLDTILLKQNAGSFELTSLATILAFVLVTVTFVKPFPDYKAYKTISKAGGKTTELIAVVATTLVKGHLDAATTGAAANVNQPSGTHNPNNAAATKKSDDKMSEKGSFIKTVSKFLMGQQSWRSAEFRSPIQHYHFLFVSVTVLFYCLAIGIFAFSLRFFRFVQFLPVLGGMFLGIMYLKSVGYLSMAVAPILIWKLEAGDFSEFKLGRIVTGASVFAVALLTLNLLLFALQSKVGRFFGVGEHELGLGHSHKFSGAVPEYVLRNYPRNRMFTQYNIGGYLIWCWWPYKKVFMDSKGSAYKNSFFREYGTKNQKQLFLKYNLHFIVNPITAPLNLNFYLASENWNLLAYDEGLALWGARDLTSRKPPLRRVLLSPSVWRGFSDARKNRFRDFIKLQVDLWNKTRRSK